jgi:phosphatidylinositol dimannoside acyltransferase
MSDPARLARDAAALAVSEVTARAIPRLPPSWRVASARALGTLRAAVSRGTRRLVVEELERCFGPSVARDPEVLRRTFANIWLDGVEPHLFPHLGPDNIDQWVQLVGEEHLRAALARGKGALLFIGHFGLNTLTMAALGHRGYRINQLSAPPTVWKEILGDQQINRFAQARAERTWNNEQTLPAQHISVFGFLRPAFQALKRNEILCVAIDGGGGQRFAEVSFLGRPCNVSTGPASLARRTGAAVLPAVVLRRDDGTHSVIIEPALEVPRTSDREADEKEVTQRFMDLLAAWAERYPDHYAGFLRLRRNTASTDTEPFFADYAPGEGS